MDIHLRFGLKIFLALRAGLPVPSVTFVVVIAAKGIAAMVSGATVVGVGERPVLVLIIANPLAATLRLG